MDSGDCGTENRDFLSRPLYRFRCRRNSGDSRLKTQEPFALTLCSSVPTFRWLNIVRVELSFVWRLASCCCPPSRKRALVYYPLACDNGGLVAVSPFSNLAKVINRSSKPLGYGSSAIQALSTVLRVLCRRAIPPARAGDPGPWLLGPARTGALKGVTDRLIQRQSNNEGMLFSNSLDASTS